MNRLIRNELKKIFGKKLIYVIFLIIIGFIVLINATQTIDVHAIYDKYEQERIVELEEELATIDYNTKEYNEYYIDLKTDYDTIKLKLDYGIDSWQSNYIDRDAVIFEQIRTINENIYGLNKDNKKLKEAQNQFNKIKSRLDAGDWKSFVKEQLDLVNEEISECEKSLENIEDVKMKESLNENIEYAKITRQVLKWRLEKEISYDNSFLANQIDMYESYAQEVCSLEKIENKTNSDKENYKLAIKEMNISKYYIENNINIENENSARTILANMAQEYGFFIIIFSIIIAGTIVSSEFQKGTIKSLLTKPYSRYKILLAKYITSILCIFLFISIFGITQYVVGGIIYGFNDYQIPIVEYNHTINGVVEIPVLEYGIVQILSNLPIYILLSTLAFALSTIIMNSACSVAVPILGYMVSEIINSFIEKVKLLKYFVTANWNLSVYLYGGQGITDGLNFGISLVICVIYLVIMLAFAFTVFRKRDIRNV